MPHALTNTQTSYGLVAQILHWITAVLILTLGGIGLIMTELPDGTQQDVDDKFLVYSLHKTLGVTLLAIALLRVAWALFQPHPRPLHPERTLDTLAAQTVHWALYGAILAMPITGWLQHAATEGLAPIWWPFSQNLPFVPDDPKLAEFFGLAHTSTAYLLGGALVLHIAGALKHAVIDKDGTLRRMIPGRGSAGPDNLPETKHRVLPAALAAGAFVAHQVKIRIALEATRAK